MIPFYFRYAIYTFFLIILQILLFDHINLFGFSNPFVYLLLFIIYRFDFDQFNFIIYAFLVGLCIDLLSQSGGAHSLASVCLAYLRPVISRLTLGVNYNLPNAMYTSIRWPNRMLYAGTSIFIHLLIFSTLIYFSMAHFWIILKHTLINSLFSFILIYASIELMRREK